MEVDSTPVDATALQDALVKILQQSLPIEADSIKVDISQVTENMSNGDISQVAEEVPSRNISHVAKDVPSRDISHVTETLPARTIGRCVADQLVTKMMSIVWHN